MADDVDSREMLVDELCARQKYFVGLFSFAVVFFLLQVPYLFVEEPGSTLYVVATMNVVGTTVFILGCGGVIYLCNRDSLDLPFGGE